MLEIQLLDWEKETGFYLDRGKMVTNLRSNNSYHISDFDLEGIVLQQLPVFKHQKAEALKIEYPELLQAMQNKVLAIEGFELEQVKELKIAIATLQNKIKLAVQAKEIEEYNQLKQTQEQQRIAELERLAELENRRKKASMFDVDITESELSLKNKN